MISIWGVEEQALDLGAPKFHERCRSRLGRLAVFRVLAREFACVR
jgi:hypothetical protein